MRSRACLKGGMYIGITFIFGLVLQGSILFTGLTTLGQLVALWLGIPFHSSMTGERCCTRPIWAIQVSHP